MCYQQIIRWNQMYPSATIFQRNPTTLSFSAGYLNLANGLAAQTFEGVANFTTVFLNYSVNPQVCGELVAHIFML